MKIRPRLGQVVVEINKSESKSKGRALITKTVKGEGEVISIGGNMEDLAVGQTVVFGKYSGIDFEIDGKLIKILKSDEILAVLEEKAQD